MVKIRKKYPLSKKERRRVAREASSFGKVFSDLVLGASIVEVAELMSKRKISLIIVDQRPVLMIMDNKVMPSLYSVWRWRNDLILNIIFVDEGAVRFILNGADIMAPGVVGWKTAFSRGDILGVSKEGEELPFSIGLALVSSNEFPSRGKVVKNLRYIKDKIWNEFEELWIKRDLRKLSDS